MSRFPFGNAIKNAFKTNHGRGDNLMVIPKGATIGRPISSLFSLFLDVKDFGAKGDGITDDTTAIQNAVNAADDAGAGILFFGAGTFLIPGGLTISNKVTLVGAGKERTILKYVNSGPAIIIYRCNPSLTGFYIETTHDAATGIRINAPSEKPTLNDLYIHSSPTSATNTGIGLHLDASANGVIQGLEWNNVYILGYKTALKTTGSSDANTVTSICGKNIFLVGRAPGVVAGSKAIDMDSQTNGVASMIVGGTIEAFDIGINVANGDHSGMGFGISYIGDFEGNNVNYSVGSSYSGQIWNLLSGERFEQGVNGTANKWFQERDKDGISIKETYYDQKHVIYNGGGAVQEFSFYRGNSAIEGGSPELQWGVFSDGSGGTAPANNYMRLKTRKITYTDNTGLAPTAGTWTTGDIVFNYIHGSGTNSKDGVSYYQCISSGTPGLWQPIHYDIEGAVSWTPGLIGAGAQVTQDVTIAGYGIDFTSFVKCQPPGALGGLILQAFIDSATVIRLTLYNPTAGGLTGPSGSYKVRVQI